MDYPNETVFLILLEHFVNFVHFLLTTLSVLSSFCQCVVFCASVSHGSVMFQRILSYLIFCFKRYTEVALILSIQTHKHMYCKVF